MSAQIIHADSQTPLPDTNMPHEHTQSHVTYSTHATRVIVEPAQSSMSVLSFPTRNSHFSAADWESREKKLIMDAQQYSLPPVIQHLVNSYVQMASSMSIIYALLAGVQIGMAQLVMPGLNPAPGWLLLRWLTYAGIYLNSGASVTALAFINYACYLPSSARVLTLTDSSSWPYRVEQGEMLPLKMLNLPYVDSDFDLMLKFGLKANMRHIWHALNYGFYFTSLMTFVSLTVWVWLNEGLAVALSLSILIAPPAGWLAASFFFTAEHVPSVPKELAKNLSFCLGTVFRGSWDV